MKPAKRRKPNMRCWSTQKITPPACAWKPITGRSHQLRVHMLALGHPILGDRFYATPEALAMAPRLLLHAETLTITHPAYGNAMTFRAPIDF